MAPACGQPGGRPSRTQEPGCPSGRAQREAVEKSVSGEPAGKGKHQFRTSFGCGSSDNALNAPVRSVLIGR
jgi:hypothetical protein